MKAEFRVHDPEGRLVTTLRFFEKNGAPNIDTGRFINSGEVLLNPGDVLPLIVAASNKDWVALDRHTKDFFPWYCRDCGRVYHQDQWETWAVFDDDPGSGYWCEGYRGSCPLGHERVVAG